MHEIKRGDIFLAELHNDCIGSEQSKTRPVIIIQNNMGNRYSPTCTVVPTTSILKKNNMPTHVLLSNTKCTERLSMALAEQITTISKTRLICYIGEVNWEDLKKVENAIMIQNGLLEEYRKEII
jgi:mRNA interferase MazF